MEVKIKFITEDLSGEFSEVGKSNDIPFTWEQIASFGISKEDFNKKNRFEIEAIKQGNKWEIKKIELIEQSKKAQITDKGTKKVAKSRSKKIQLSDTDFDTSHVPNQRLTENINFNLFLNKPHHREIGNLFNQDKKSSNNLYDKEGDKKDFDKIGLKNKQLGERKSKLEDFVFSGVDLILLRSRNIENAKNLFGDNNIDASIHLKPDWRLALGIGGASVYETSITLHHIYGIPYLPASAVKGITRSYIIQEVFEDKEDEAILDKDFCDIFGCSKEHEIIKNKKKSKYPSHYKADREGKVTFFDSFPTDKINISLDIMNVHYKEYYNSKSNEDDIYEEGSVSPPADWSTPSIINFLTVKETHFQFIVASNSNLSECKIDNKNIVDWLKEALTQKGIGAKTAVGYGYMSEQ